MFIRDDTAAIILAAGSGTRMKSDTAKVLHEINGKSMISYVINSVAKLVGKNLLVVIGHQSDIVRKAVCQINSDVIFVLQKQQLGTGHAVICAMPFIPEYIRNVLILCGDTPLITTEALNNLVINHKMLKSDVTFLAAKTDSPYGYGRVLLDEKREVIRIVEDIDATEEEKKISIINTGVYCISKEFLLHSSQKIKKKGEFYLTEVIEIGFKSNKKTKVLIDDFFDEYRGVNTSTQLRLVEKIMQKQFR